MTACLRSVIVPLCLALLALCACTDKEDLQRAEFISLLERNVLQRPGVRFTLPTDEEYARIGPHYAAQFALLLEPNQDEALKRHLEAFGPLQQRLEHELEPEERRTMLGEVRGSFADSMQAVGAALQRMQSTRQGFAQSPDLKEAYDKAFAQVVARPLETMLDLYDCSIMLFDSVRDINDLMLSNPGAVVYRNGRYVIRKPEVAGELERLLAVRNERFREMSRCAAELQGMVQ